MIDTPKVTKVSIQMKLKKYLNEVVFFEELLESEGTLVQDPVDVGGHGQAPHAPEHAPKMELRPSGMNVVQ